ncbi:hypothetical protein [Amycolatopsis sp. H20-H5]|uniref:hypothetical protein n=1 Tax=Amycolatopsis sp. H20-H5 TaxID=3046309 RepID=UPI002DBA4DDC|nr:hypothetical protein [Amycolatopsis sp. H20-H5]MEC3976246.1 hypothetical protein [Amycolatopsis sp. H20-H5]
MPLVDFARLWIAAEQRYEQDKTWANFGVVDACRWLACATVRPPGGRPCYLAYAPVTERTGLAHEEVIEAETLAAEVLLHRRPVPTWVANRPGWLPAVVKTLMWAWRGTKPANVHAHAQG